MLIENLERRQLLAADISIDVDQGETRYLQAHEVGIDDQSETVLVQDLPDVGRLEQYGSPVDLYQEIDYWSLESGELYYISDSGGSGAYLDEIEFVSSYDSTDVFTLEISVSSASNTPPTALPETVNVESQLQVIPPTSFGYNDEDGDDLSAVVIESLPEQGTLLLYGTGVAVGTSVDSDSLNAGALQYELLGEAGTDAFSYRVSDGMDTSEIATLPLTLGELESDPLNQVSSSVIVDSSRAAVAIQADHFGSSGAPFSHVVVEQLPQAGQLVVGAASVAVGDSIEYEQWTNSEVQYLASADLADAYSANAEFTVYEYEQPLRTATVNFLVEAYDAPSDPLDAPVIEVLSSTGMASITPSAIGVTDISGYQSIVFDQVPEHGTLSSAGIQVVSGEEIDIWQFSYQPTMFQAASTDAAFSDELRYRLFDGIDYTDEVVVSIEYEPISTDAELGATNGNIEWVEFVLGADEPPAAGQVWLDIDGQTTGSYQTLEYDLNDDGEFEGLVSIDSFGHFSQSVAVPETGIANVGFRFTGDDGDVANWVYHPVVVNWPSQTQAFEITGQLQRHSDIEPGSYTDRLVLTANISGVSGAHFVDVEIDYQGDELANEVFGVDPNQEVQLLLIPEVITPKIWARVVRFDELSFEDVYSEWFEFELEIPVGDPPSEDPNGDGGDPSGDDSTGDDSGGDNPTDDPGDEYPDDNHPDDYPNGDGPSGEDPNGDYPDGNDPYDEYPNGDDPSGEDPNDTYPDGDDPYDDYPDGDDPYDDGTNGDPNGDGSGDDGSGGDGSGDGSDGDGSNDGSSGDGTNTDPTAGLTIDNLAFWPEAPPIYSPTLPDWPATPGGLVLSYEIGPSPQPAANNDDPSGSDGSDGQDGPPDDGSSDDGSGDSTDQSGDQSGSDQSGSDQSGSDQSGSDQSGDGSNDTSGDSSNSSDGSNSNSADGTESAADAAGVSNAILGAFGSFAAATIGTVGAVDYETAIANAEAQLDADRLAVFNTYQTAVQNAQAAYASAIAGSVGPDTEASAQDVANAAQDHKDAVASDTEVAQAAYDIAVANAQETHDNSKQQAEQDFQNASEAAWEAHQENIAPIMDAMADLEEQLSNGDINQATYDSSMQGLESALEAEEDAHALVVSGHQKTRDDKIVDAEATLATKEADATKAYNDAIADAGKQKYEDYLDALKDHEEKIVEKNIAEWSRLAGARRQLKKDLAAAGTAKSIGLINANETFLKAKQDAIRDRVKAAINDNHGKSETSINNEADAQIAAENGNTSHEATYRIAAVNAQRDADLAANDAGKTRSLDQADADHTLATAQISASAALQRAAASARGTATADLADAVATFKGSYFAAREIAGKDAVQARITATGDFDAAKRDFDKEMAGVQKTRANRMANELKDNRKDQLLATNEFNHGIIDQATYESTSQSLSEDAADITRTIQIETMGDPTASPGDPVEPGGESAARLGYLEANMNASKALGAHRSGSRSQMASDSAAWIDQLEEDSFEARATQQDDNLAARLGSYQTIANAINAWVSSMVGAENAFISAVSGASSDQAIDLAEAGATFQIDTTTDYANAVSAHATANPDNINAQHADAVAAANLTRVTDLATAYEDLVRATAPATATQTADEMIAANNYLLAYTSESVTADGKIRTAESTHRTTTRAAQKAHVMGVAATNNAFNGKAASATHLLNLGIAAAKSRRQFDMMVAYVVGWLDAASDPLIFSSAQSQARKDMEKAVGITFIESLVDDRTDFEEDLADATEARTKGLAQKAANLLSDTTAADAQFAIDVSVANTDMLVELAKAYATYHKALANARDGGNTARVNAEATFAKAMADATRDYSHAVSDADKDRAIDKAQAEHDEIDAWAGVGAGGTPTPYEQYMLDHADAALAYTTTTAPLQATYEKNIADKQRTAHNNMVDAEKTAKLDGAASRLTYAEEVADADETYHIALANAFGTEEQSLYGLQSGFFSAIAGYGETLAGEFATALKDHKYETTTLSGDATKAAGGVSGQLHNGGITQLDHDAQITIINENLLVAFEEAIKTKTNNFADAIDLWADDVAAEDESFATSHSGFVKARVKSVASAAGAAETAKNQALVTMAGDLDSQHETLANAMETETNTLTVDSQSEWETFSNGLGAADVTFANSVATAEADMHVASAQQHVNDLNAQWPTPTPEQQFEIAVAEAHADYLAQVSPAYVTAMTQTAQNSVDYQDSVTSAQTTLDTTLGPARSAFVSTIEAAYVAASSDMLSAAVGRADAYNGALVDHVKNSADHHDQRVTDEAATTKSAAIAFANAETQLMRDRAAYGVDSVKFQLNLSTIPPDQSYLDNYVAARAGATYTLTAGRINAAADLKIKILDEDVTYITAAADANKSATLARSGAAKTLAEAIATANRDYEHAAFDARATFDKDVAKAGRDYVVADAQATKDALIAQYDAAANVYQSHFGTHPDPGVQMAIATVVGNAAWANALGPDFVTQQTSLADALLTFAETMIDAQATAGKAYADADRDKAIAEAGAAETYANDMASALRDAQVNLGTARVDYSKAVTNANRARKLAMAALWRDAQIDAGYWGDPQIDPADVASVTATATTTLNSASSALSSATETETQNYIDALLNGQYDQAEAIADAELAHALAIIGANEILVQADIDATKTLTKAQIDANADFAIAELDANLIGLQALAMRHTTPATTAAAAQAGADKPAAIADIDAQRVADKATADTKHTEDTASLADDVADATANANAAHASAIDAADAAKLAGLDGVTVPGIETPGRLGWNASASSLIIGAGPDLTDNLLDEFGYGQDDWSSPSVGGGMQGAFTGISDMAVAHVVLDIVGMIPLVGIAADVVNGALYLYEGDHVNAGISFAAAVPGVGYIANGIRGAGHASDLYKAARSVDIAQNFVSSGYSMGQGAIGVAMDPSNPMGYVGIAAGAFGFGMNVRAYRNPPQCFVAGTLVVMDEDVNGVASAETEMASVWSAIDGPYLQAASLILVGVVMTRSFKQRKRRNKLNAVDDTYASWEDEQYPDWEVEPLARRGIRPSENVDAAVAAECNDCDLAELPPLKTVKIPEPENFIHSSRAPEAEFSQGTFVEERTVRPSTFKSLTSWMLGAVTAAIFIFGLVEFGNQDSHPGHPSNTAIAEVSRPAQRQLQSIETIRLGQRVKTDVTNQQLEAAIGDLDGLPWWDRAEIEPDEWRQIELEITKPNGSLLTLELLRPSSWIAQQRAEVGNSIHIAIEDMGIDAPAIVLGIDKCPPISEGNGQVVTGRFIHASGRVMTLWLDGESVPIGVTEEHPFYSVDRQRFVPVRELEPGETVETLDGIRSVARAQLTQQRQAVYNLEIQGEHVYRVTSAGLLAHNSYPASSPRNNRKPPFKHDVMPEDAPVPVARFELLNEGGKWITKASDGTTRSATGKYIFVTQNGKTYVQRDHLPNGHIDIGRGRPVDYAGEIQFSGRHKRGVLRKWTNGSGHYLPTKEFASNAGLPMDKFQPVPGS